MNLARGCWVAADLDEPLSPYLQVAILLRTAILTKKFTESERLPSQPDRPERCDLARMTIRQAVRELLGRTTCETCTSPGGNGGRTPD